MTNQKTTLTLHIHPNAKRNEVLGFEDGILRLKIAAPPVEGKANKELISFLGKTLGIRKSGVTIDRGETSKVKIVTVLGIDREQIYEMIEAARKK
ncbi:MAG: DUF167 domain-containing protein [Dehalococcoidia bacterium]|jgi:hypothetical protein